MDILASLLNWVFYLTNFIAASNAKKNEYCYIFYCIFAFFLVKSFFFLLLSIDFVKVSITLNFRKLTELTENKNTKPKMNPSNFPRNKRIKNPEKERDMLNERRLTGLKQRTFKMITNLFCLDGQAKIKRHLMASGIFQLNYFSSHGSERVQFLTTISCTL